MSGRLAAPPAAWKVSHEAAKPFCRPLRVASAAGSFGVLEFGSLLGQCMLDSGAPRLRVAKAILHDGERNAKSRPNAKAPFLRWTIRWTQPMVAGRREAEASAFVFRPSLRFPLAARSGGRPWRRSVPGLRRARRSVGLGEAVERIADGGKRGRHSGDIVADSMAESEWRAAVTGEVRRQGGWGWRRWIPRFEVPARRLVRGQRGSIP